MSERQTPQSHSRVKSITNKNTFPHSEKKDGGKVSTNATANDSQAVVNYNRQQRFSQQNSSSYNSSFAKGDKTDQQYYSQQKAPYKYKNNSNQGQAKSGKYSYSGVSKSQQQTSVPVTRVFTPSKPSSNQSISPEPIPPPPINKDNKAPVLQGAWANPPRVRSEFDKLESPSPLPSLSPISTDPDSLNIEDTLSPKWTEQSGEYLESDKYNNNRGEASPNPVNWAQRKREIRKMPAPTASGPRSGANSGISGSQGDRMMSGQDRNSPTGNSHSTSHVARSGSNSINGPTSGVGSPSGSSVSVNGLERCPIGSTVKCVMLHPSGQAHNGLNGPSSGVNQGQQMNMRHRNVFEGEVLAMDPRTKVLVLKCPSSCGKSSAHDVHIINLSLQHEIKILADKKETVSPPSSLNITRLENRLREQVEKKKKQIMAFKTGVSPEGQKLFQAICKTIDDVTWHGENIYVLKEITIYPPYRPENVKGNMDSKALKHVRKIVEKHISDQSLASLSSTVQSPGDSSPYSTPTQTARGSIPAGVTSLAARATSPASPISSPQSSAGSREAGKSGSSANTLPNQPSNKNNSREGSKRGTSASNSNTHGSSGSTSDRSHGSGSQSSRNASSSQHHSHYQNVKSSSYNQ